jgi:hypothetical protein
MPRIIVMSESNIEMSESNAEREGAITLDEMMGEPSTQSEGAITLDERVTSDDLRSGHHSAQLIERVGWAVHDADDEERADAEVAGSPIRPLRSSARRARALTN